MKLIPLSQGKFAQVDDEDYDRVMKFKWHTWECRRTWYAITNIYTEANKRTSLLMHIFIMGDNPLRFEIDHIKGDGLDNQKHMLRFCTHPQNGMNQKSQRNTSSKYKGVSWHKGHKKWVCYISTLGKRIWIGYFINENDAAQAYNNAATKYFGEFAMLNIIEYN